MGSGIGCFVDWIMKGSVKKINTAPKWVCIVTAITVGLICLVPLFFLGILFFALISMDVDFIEFTIEAIIKLTIFIVISLILSSMFSFFAYKFVKNIRKEFLYTILAFILVIYIVISPKIYTFLITEELTTNIKIEK